MQAVVCIKSEKFYSRIVFGGSVGAGEAYIENLWDTDNLVGLCRIICLNRNVNDNMERGLARLTAPFLKLYNFLRKNTVSGSRKNIAEHYDIGNDFYELMLDETMMYSAGIYEDEKTPLLDASVRKLDTICQKLNLTENDHVLEIGTGWGGFAIHAAQVYGCRVTTTTISKEQYEYALKRVKQLGLSNRVEVLFEDYRNLTGKFSKIVSIEMIEAVGWQFYREFFRVCDERLEDDGSMLIQAITIADQHYEQARREVDFIKRYVFPGCCIPSICSLNNAATEASSLRMYHFDDNAQSYAWTLRDWRKNFHRTLDQVREMGYSEKFIRMWNFYLSYCEAGFLERNISSVQVVYTKPDARPDPIHSR